jgi:hypothetical protein
MVEEVVESDKVQLGLNVGVLRKLDKLAIGQSDIGSTYMTTGKRLFSTERLLNTVAVTKDWQNSLEIKLTGLSQVWSLTIVVKLEKSRATLDLGLHESRRADLLDIQLLVDGVESILDNIANEHNGGGLLVAEGEVSEVHEGVGITIDRDNVGESIVTSGSLGDNSEVVCAEFAIERSVSTSGNLPKFTNNLKRGFSGECESIVCLGKIARKETLHIVDTTAQSDKDKTTLLGHTVDTALNGNTLDTLSRLILALSESTNHRRIGLLEVDRDRLGQGRVVGDLGLLKDSKTSSLILGILLSTLGSSVELLLLTSSVGDSLLQSRLGSGLVLFIVLLLDLVLSLGAVAEVSLEEGLEGGGLGALNLGEIASGFFVDVNDRHLVVVVSDFVNAKTEFEPWLGWRGFAAPRSILVGVLVTGLIFLLQPIIGLWKDQK